MRHVIAGNRFGYGLDQAREHEQEPGERPQHPFRARILSQRPVLRRRSERGEAGAGLAALAAAAQNWALRQNTRAERVLWAFAGLLLVFPSLIEAIAESISGYDVPHPAPLGLAIAAALLL